MLNSIRSLVERPTRAVQSRSYWTDDTREDSWICDSWNREHHSHPDSVLRDQAWSVRGAYLHRRLTATPAASVGYGDLCTGVGSLGEYDVVLE